MALRRCLSWGLLLGFACCVRPTGIVGAEPSAQQRTRRWAVLVGVNDYSYITKLNYCSDDVVALRDQLVASGYPERQVFVLHDKAPEKRYLPFKSNIEQQLELVFKLVGPNDVVVLAFSGHGMHVDGTSYLCPTDAKVDDPKNTMVSLDWVYSQLKDCPAAFKLLLVDACRNDPRPGGHKSARDLADDSRKFAQPLEKAPEGIVLLNSCSPGEVSMEDKDFGHGVFMHYILEGLGGQADENHDGLVTLQELAGYTELETKTHVARKYSDSQRPFLRGDLTVEALRFTLARASLPEHKMQPETKPAPTPAASNTPASTPPDRLQLQARKKANGENEREYVVWVYKSEAGNWVKQSDRTLNTDDAKAANEYVAQVMAVTGWTATTNAPEPPAESVVGTWTGIVTNSSGESNSIEETYFPDGTCVVSYKYGTFSFSWRQFGDTVYLEGREPVGGRTTCVGTLRGGVLTIEASRADGKSSSARYLRKK